MSGSGSQGRAAPDHMDSQVRVIVVAIDDRLSG